MAPRFLAKLTKTRRKVSRVAPSPGENSYKNHNSPLEKPNVVLSASTDEEEIYEQTDNSSTNPSAQKGKRKIFGEINNKFKRMMLSFKKMTTREKRGDEIDIIKGNGTECGSQDIGRSSTDIKAYRSIRMGEMFMQLVESDEDFDFNDPKFIELQKEMQEYQACLYESNEVCPPQLIREKVKIEGTINNHKEEDFLSPLCGHDGCDCLDLERRAMLDDLEHEKKKTQVKEGSMSSLNIENLFDSQLDDDDSESNIFDLNLLFSEEEYDTPSSYNIENNRDCSLDNRANLRKSKGGKVAQLVNIWESQEQ